MDKRTEQIIQIVAGAALVIGCLLVLKPFFAALLSAAILCAGESLDAGWREIAGSKAALAEALKRIAQPARAVLVQAGIIVGEGVLQFTLIAFIGFFFYRDGAALAQSLRNGLERVAGNVAGRLLEIVGGTINGVMY